MKSSLIIITCIIFLTFTSIHGKDTMLLPGTVAPNFSLVSDKGDTIRMSDYRSKNPVVLVFYPGDETPGCTRQLCAIRDDYSRFESKGAKVFGVNPANRESHAHFINKENYQFRLLVDTDQKVAELYGAQGPSVQRTVYVIGADGKIAFAQRGMPADSEILAAIKPVQKQNKQ